MKQRINIVIDLETASLRSDAAIMSIAAQVFDPLALLNNPHALPFPPEGKSPSPQFTAVVNVASCITAGLDVDKATCRWWSERSDEAKASVLATPVLLATALEELSKWLDLLRSHLDADVRLWCQGTDFDIPILANAFRVCGLELPWRHTDVRDARTFILEGLEDLFGLEERPYDRIPPMPEGEAWVAHSALSDARRTAWSIANVNAMQAELLAKVEKRVVPAKAK